MKLLILLLTLPLCGSTVNKHYKPKPIPKAHLHLEEDMNSIPFPRPSHPTPEQMQQHLDNDKLRDAINRQTKLLQELAAAVKYTHKRLDFLQESMANLHQQVEELPTCKHCYRR
jgi:small-conductance mechanosensitive channel